MVLLQILFTVLLQFIPISADEPTQCIVVMDDLVEDCFKEKYNFKELYFRQKNMSETKNRSNNDICINERVCRYTYKITYLRRQLYTFNIFNHFAQLLEACCGNCSGYRIINTVTQLSHINKGVLDQSDVIFPLLATKSVTQLYGFRYIPVFEVPSAFYLTLSPTSSERMTQLMIGILNTWPLILICLLLALISGFIIWNMEKRINTVEFPKGYIQGMVEGFWWSFVSMTTVGYGDKTPRSMPGRLFAIIWILIGITIFALLTGDLTNQINSIQSHPKPELLGKRVGGLRHKFHESTMVAQHGGFFHGIFFNNTIAGIGELINRLERKEIDGFLISRPSYYFFHTYIEKESNHIDDLTRQNIGTTLKRVKMDITEKYYVGEALTLGMIVKSNEAYEYFRTYSEYNWIQIQNCNAFKLSKKATEHGTKQSETILKGFFFNFFYVLLVIIGIIVGCGLFRRVYKRYKERKEDMNENGENAELNGNNTI